MPNVVGQRGESLQAVSDGSPSTEIRSKNSFTAMALEKACGAGRASSRSDLALDQREHTSCSWMVLGVEVMRRS
jgi:hypothetical protein